MIPPALDGVIESTHDGRGLVRAGITVQQLSPPEWSFRAALELGAGAHLDRIATDLLHVFPEST